MNGVEATQLHSANFTDGTKAMKSKQYCFRNQKWPNVTIVQYEIEEGNVY